MARLGFQSSMSSHASSAIHSSSVIVHDSVHSRPVRLSRSSLIFACFARYSASSFSSSSSAFPLRPAEGPP